MWGRSKENEAGSKNSSLSIQRRSIHVLVSHKRRWGFEFLSYHLTHLFTALAPLGENLDEDLHAADEDGGEGLDLLEVLPEALPLTRVQKVLLTTLNVVGHLNI